MALPDHIATLSGHVEGQTDGRSGVSTQGNSPTCVHVVGDNIINTAHVLLLNQTSCTRSTRQDWT